MIEFYSEKFEPKQSTIEKLLMFSKSISALKLNNVKEIIILNLN
ncbi:Uncharacterised protein [Empedobacter falsenii]|uniref:Uncharacterized protein n=1 Tax=Empedobacter falsenii TaxID=343874 RepID=A0A376GL79_9FLAO|nr:Uncharacterised protein [Empedobacter falsenii]